MERKHMQNHTDMKSECQQEKALIEAEQSRLRRHIRWVSTLRVVLFLTALLSISFYIAGEKFILLPIVSAVGLVLFLALVKYHTRLFTRYSRGEIKLAVCRTDLAHLDEDYSGQRAGEEYVDAAHDFAYDIDLYGRHSLFQMLNRTCSDVGSHRLAEVLSRPLTDTTAIRQRQQLLQTMGEEKELLTRFRVELLCAAAEDYATNGRKGDERLLTLGNADWEAWTASPDEFASRWYYRLLTPATACTNLMAWGAAIAGVLPYSLASLVTILFAIVSSAFTTRITRKQQEYSRRLHTLSLVAPALELVEQAPCKEFAAWQQIARGVGQERGGVSASSAIRQLRRLMDNLDRRNNVVMLFLLNGLFFWEIRQMIRLERWKRLYACHIPAWMDALARADAYVSMALFARHHPDYTWPDALEGDGDFTYTATALSHPLMRRGTCVPNPIEIDGRPDFLVITGANMAGKSTYLRTVSINYLLACVGLPVCGTEMTFTSARLLTSLRTADSLSDGESYFFAELKRLKLIIDSLKRGEQLFIVLDEILRGTNSVDKQKGSLALLRQLVRLRANGIIATHDLLLGTLADHYPTHVHNHCFEANIRDDQLTFAYRLRPGIAQNMNACFLMQQMGIGEGEW